MSSILENVPVVILAGGLGTRLRSVLPDRPKSLAPVGSQTFLEVQVGLLREQGARHFTICAGYLSQHIQSLLGDGSRLGVEVSYSLENDKLLGTAGALKLAAHFFKPRAIVLNGDTYFALDYARLYEHHLAESQTAGVLATCALSHMENAEAFGNVLLDESEQYIREFLEKPYGHEPSNAWINGGVYVIERLLLECIPAGVYCSLEKDVFPAVLKTGGKLAAHQESGHFFDIGTPASWHVFLNYYLEKHHA